MVITQKVVSKAEGRLVPVDPDDLEAHRRRWSCPRAPGYCASATSSSSRRRTTASCAPTPAWTSPTSATARLPCCPSTPTAAPATSATLCGPAPAWRWRSSSRTPSARPGATASPTSPSGAPASPPWSTCGAPPTLSGRELAATEICVVDEIAAAAELAKGKASGVPVVIVRGVPQLVPGVLGAGGDQCGRTGGTCSAELRQKLEPSGPP